MNQPSHFTVKGARTPHYFCLYVPAILGHQNPLLSLSWHPLLEDQIERAGWRKLTCTTLSEITSTMANKSSPLS